MIVFNEKHEKNELYPQILKISNELNNYILEQKQMFSQQNIDVNILFSTKERQKWQTGKYNPIFYQPSNPNEEQLTFNPLLRIIIKQIKFIVSHSNLPNKYKEIIDEIDFENFYLTQNDLGQIYRAQEEIINKTQDLQEKQQMQILQFLLSIVYLQILYLIIFDYYYYFKEKLYIEFINKQEIQITFRFLDDLDQKIKESYLQQNKIYSTNRNLLNIQTLFQEKYSLITKFQQKSQEVDWTYVKTQLYNILYLLKLLIVIGQQFGQIRISLQNWLNQLDDFITNFNIQEDFDIRDFIDLDQSSKGKFFKYSNVVNLVKNNVQEQQDPNSTLSQLILDLSSMISQQRYVITDTLQIEDQIKNIREPLEIGQWSNSITNQNAVPEGGRFEITLKQINPLLNEFIIDGIYFVFDPFREDQEFQVDFMIEYYDIQGELLQIDIIQGNNQQYLFRGYNSPIQNVNIIKVIITKWSKHNSQIKIYRIVPKIQNNLNYIEMPNLLNFLKKIRFGRTLFFNIMKKEYTFKQQQLINKLHYCVNNLLFLQMIPEFYFIKHNQCSFILDEIQLTFIQKFLSVKEIHLRCLHINQIDTYMNSEMLINIMKKTQDFVQKYIQFYVFQSQIDENLWNDFLKNVKLQIEYNPTEFKKYVVQILQHMQQQMFLITQENRMQQNIVNIFEQSLYNTNKMQKNYDIQFYYLFFKEDLDKYNLYQLIKYFQFKGSRLIINRIINNIISYLKTIKNIYISDFVIPRQKFDNKQKTVLLSDRDLEQQKFLGLKQIYPPYIKFQTLIDLIKYKNLLDTYERNTYSQLISDFNKLDSRRGNIVMKQSQILYYKDRTVQSEIQKDFDLFKKILDKMLPIWLSVSFLFDYIYQPSSLSDLLMQYEWYREMIKIIQKFVWNTQINIIQKDILFKILNLVYQVYGISQTVEGFTDYQEILRLEMIIDNQLLGFNPYHFKMVSLQDIKEQAVLIT